LIASLAKLARRGSRFFAAYLVVVPAASLKDLGIHQATDVIGVPGLAGAALKA